MAQELEKLFLHKVADMPQTVSFFVKIFWSFDNFLLYRK